MVRITRQRGGAGPPPTTVLTRLTDQLRAQGYDHTLALPGPEPCAVAWAEPGGASTPRVFLLAAADDWARGGVDYVQERVWSLTPPETPDDAYPQFAVVGDATYQAIFDLSYPPHQLDRLPPPTELAGRRRVEVPPR
jgi:type I restriction enzyme M protein